MALKALGYKLSNPAWYWELSLILSLLSEVMGNFNVGYETILYASTIIMSSCLSVSQHTILPYFGGRHMCFTFLSFLVAVNLTVPGFSTAQFSCCYLVLSAYQFKATAASL